MPVRKTMTLPVMAMAGSPQRTPRLAIPPWSTPCALAATSSRCSVTSRPWPIPGTPTPMARCGTRSWACGPPRRSPQGWTSGRSTRTSCSTWPPPGPTCWPVSTRPPVSPPRTALTASTSTARSSGTPPRRRPPTWPRTRLSQFPPR